MGSMREYGKVAAVLGISIVMASLVFGVFFFESRKPQQTITVVGIASKQYEADTVKWSLTLTERTGLDDLPGGRHRLHDALQELVAFLNEQGVKAEQISIIPPNVYENYGSSGVDGYRLEQEIYVISKDVDTIDNLALNVIPVLTEILTSIAQGLNIFIQISMSSKEHGGGCYSKRMGAGFGNAKRQDMSLGKLKDFAPGVFQDYPATLHRGIKHGNS